LCAFSILYFVEINSLRKAQSDERRIDTQINRGSSDNTVAGVMIKSRGTGAREVDLRVEVREGSEFP
jgi:hypothetical protein